MLHRIVIVLLYVMRKASRNIGELLKKFPGYNKLGTNNPMSDTLQI